MQKVIDWKDGNGAITVEFDGTKDGVISITSTPNNTGAGRSQEITIETTYSYAVTKTFLVYQEGSGSIDGGIASTSEYSNIIDCSTADSEYAEGEDDLFDGGAAGEDEDIDTGNEGSTEPDAGETTTDGEDTSEDNSTEYDSVE